jgi:seryl-tRNA synthetase
MKTVTFYVAGLLCLLATKLTAQEKAPQTFEQRAKEISKNIETITKQQKDSLKVEVESVNIKLDNKEITADQAEAQKQQYAEKRAKNIEAQVAVEEGKLDQLVKDQVDGKVSYSHKKKHNISIITYEKGDDESDTTKVIVKRYDYKRTTSQFVYALGANRLVTDGSIDNDNFKDRSDFYEVGVAWNTRLFTNNNLLP